MRHLQTYRVFETAQVLTDEQKEFLDESTRGTWSLNPSTGKVDIDGNFECVGLDLKDFKGISFGSVSKNFYCYSNSLQTLEGAPETVGGDFYCYRNSLQTLEGAPETVGGDFDCYSNSLQTLEGSPETVEGDFFCSKNYLRTLEGAPETIAGEFDSDEIEIPEGEWSLETLIRIFTTGTLEQKQLVAPLVDPKVLQQMIDKDPEKMLMKLKDYLKDPHFKDLKWPKHLEREKGLLSDLSDVGL